MNIYFFEILAVLAVIVWAGALVWFIGCDVAAWKHHHDQTHHPRG